MNSKIGNAWFNGVMTVVVIAFSVGLLKNLWLHDVETSVACGAGLLFFGLGWLASLLEMMEWKI